MGDDADETAIRLVIENWAAAVRAQDMEGAVAGHADDIVVFDVPLPLQARGIEEYRKTWELFFVNSPGGPGSFDVAELQIVASDTVAYCHAILEIFDSRARLTVGLRNENGNWLIAHEHHSYPLPLDSDQS